MLNWFRCAGTNSDHGVQELCYITVRCYVHMMRHSVCSSYWVFKGLCYLNNSIRSRLWEQCEVKGDLAFEMFLADVTSGT